MTANDLLVLSLVKHIHFLSDIGCADGGDIRKLCRMAENALIGEPLRPHNIDQEEPCDAG